MVCLKNPASIRKYLVTGSEHWKIAIIGGCALALGITVYLLIRDPPSLLLNQLLPLPSHSTWAADHLPQNFIKLTGSLPTATHAFAFSLFTALALGLTKARIAIACAIWAIIETFFEFLQALSECQVFFFHDDKIFSPMVCSYILNGVFDWADVFAILLGVTLAHQVLRHYLHTRGDINE